MDKEKIAKLFSTGKFKEVYDCIAANAQWEVIEENRYIGKDKIVQNCEHVTNYFQSLTTHSNIKSIISTGNSVVIEGTAEFIKDAKTISFVKACDVYTFNDQCRIESITSYCIQSDTLPKD